MADNFLSQEEVDALLKGVNGDQDETGKPEDSAGVRPYNPVSYTHLTLPTSDLV